MSEFNWEKNRKLKEEWNEIYSSVYNSIKECGECEIKAPLYTTVRTEPGTFKKSKITAIKTCESYFNENYISLKIENEDDKMWVNVYPQFELKTDGKIRDIVMILIFIRNNVITKILKPTIV